ncbi:MAG TPA: NAD-dependent epimerase/dehydratase family protein [Verrucomicrobiae bacterium]|nr:NAD-dependent epimerase/dehydratase family protein [Verrucomicrobiae bacterium]
MNADQSGSEQQAGKGGPSGWRNVFISGGAGFIGSHLVRFLAAERSVERIVIFDNFTSGQQSYIAEVCPDARVEVVRADLKEVDAVTAAMRGCDTVFHLAANPDIAKAVTEPPIDFWEGTYLTQNVLEAMRLNGVRKILYTSGSGVYGENPSVAFKEDYGPCIPISTYGASKLACEALISAYCHMFELKARAFRFANVVGARQTHGVGYDFVRRLKADPARLRILGDGTQKKSYIHVEDVLAAIRLADERTTKSYDVFNVASDDYITVREIADLAMEVSGLPPGGTNYEFTGGDRGWKGDVPVVRFDCSKIRSLGWRPHRTSAEAVTAAMKAMIEELNCG